jgi:hypothetical protein
MTTFVDLKMLPGAELIQRGVVDLDAGRESAEALLVSIGAPRLRSVGIELPPPIVSPEHKLYLGRAVHMEGRVYLTGGATAVLYGWRDTTIDVDIKLIPDRDEILREIPRLKEALNLNVELAAPSQFNAIEPELYRFPSIDPVSFRKAVSVRWQFDTGISEELQQTTEVVNADLFKPVKGHHGLDPLLHCLLSMEADGLVIYLRVGTPACAWPSRLPLPCARESSRDPGLQASTRTRPFRLYSSE